MQHFKMSGLLLLLTTTFTGPAVTQLRGQGLASATPADTTAAPARRGPTDPVEVEAFLDGLMAAQLEEKNVVGAVVAVVRDGEVLLIKGYGYADLEARRPVDPARTLFRIGSVSKLFTWTAVMQLVEQGKLDLDENVNTYLDFAIPDTYEEPITLRHLLTHTPGFEERAVGLFSTSTEPRGEWLEENMPQRVRPPGAFSAYSNYGTALAGYTVERASGLSWEEYLERHIFEPLGMKNTTARQPLPEHLVGQMSVGYANEGSRLDPRDFEMLIPIAPAGSISSTGADMARFMIAHLQHGRYGDARILADSTARWMHQRAFSHDERLNGFALGFYEKSANGVRVIGHGGDTQWFHTDLALVPEDGVGVFVSYNTAAGGELSFGPFTQLFFERYYPADEAATMAAAADTVDLEPYVGSYRANRSSYTTFEKLLGLLSSVKVAQDPERNELLVRMGGDETRYVAVEPGLFREVGGSALAAFRRNDDGKVDYLFLGEAPMLAMVRLAWYASPTLHQILLGLGALLFLSALILIPARFALQRRFAEVPPLRRQERAARWLAVAVAVLYLGGLVGLGIVLSDESKVLNGDLDGLGVVFLLFVLAALLTLGLLWFTITAWRTGMWGRWGRIHYTAVTLGAVVFALVLNYWNLLGWNF